VLTAARRRWRCLTPHVMAIDPPPASSPRAPSAGASSPTAREPKPPPAAGAAPARPACAPLAALLTGWRAYAGQPTLLPALALSLLYLTVLSLGFLMTAYLTFNGMSEVGRAGGGVGVGCRGPPCVGRAEGPAPQPRPFRSDRWPRWPPRRAPPAPQTVLPGPSTPLPLHRRRCRFFAAPARCRASSRRSRSRASTAPRDSSLPAPPASRGSTCACRPARCQRCLPPRPATTAAAAGPGRRCWCFCCAVSWPRA
jgi:hypothetical protein